MNKLEIDVMQGNELTEAASLASKYKLPALVVHPSLATDAIIAKGKTSGRFKIIIPIDWPKGETFGVNKMLGLSTDALEADGFEIMLTPDKSEIETRNEAKTITEFVRRHISPNTEVRFVLCTSSRDNIEIMAKGMMKVPAPSFIRNDIHPKIQVSKANPEVHNETIRRITENIKLPIKICGNISELKTMATCVGVARFGVNLIQAKAIIKEFKSQPEKLVEILS